MSICRQPWTFKEVSGHVSVHWTQCDKSHVLDMSLLVTRHLVLDKSLSPLLMTSTTPRTSSLPSVARWTCSSFPLLCYVMMVTLSCWKTRMRLFGKACWYLLPNGMLKAFEMLIAAEPVNKKPKFHHLTKKRQSEREGWEELINTADRKLSHEALLLTLPKNLQRSRPSWKASQISWSNLFFFQLQSWLLLCQARLSKRACRWQSQGYCNKHQAFTSASQKLLWQTDAKLPVYTIKRHGVIFPQTVRDQCGSVIVLSSSSCFLVKRALTTSLPQPVRASRQTSHEISSWPFSSEWKGHTASYAPSAHGSMDSYLLCLVTKLINLNRLSASTARVEIRVYSHVSPAR